MAFTHRQARMVTALGGAVAAGVLFVVAAWAITSLGHPVTPNDDGTNLFEPTTSTSVVVDRSSWPPVTITTLPVEGSSSSGPAPSSSAATAPAVVGTLPPPTTAPADVLPALTFPTVTLPDVTVPPTLELPTTVEVPTTLEVSTTVEVPTTPLVSVPTTLELPTTLPDLPTSTTLE